MAQAPKDQAASAVGELHTARSGAFLSRSLREPFGMRWGMMVVSLIAAAVIVFSLWWGPPQYRNATILSSWAVVTACGMLQAMRRWRWDNDQYQHQLAALELLVRMSASIGPDVSSEEELLRRVSDALRYRMSMGKSWIGILEGDGKTIRIVASTGMDPVMVGRRMTPDEMPMTWSAINQKRVVSIGDIRQSRMPLNLPLLQGMGVRSVMQIPMIHQNEVAGVIMLADERPRKISQLDEQRVWLWGCQAAVMLSNCRLYQEMSQSLSHQQHLMAQRDALFRLNTAIQRPGELKEILHRIVELAPATLAVDAALIWLIAEDNPEEAYIAAATTPYGQKVSGFRVAIHESKKTDRVLRDRQRLIVEDGTKDPELNSRLKSILPVGSLIFEPLLRGEGDPLGLIVLIRDLPGKFSDDQLDLSRLFSRRAAAVIEMAALYDQTRRDADAKAMLLRELNHRVKNNLASIVSLLSINQPKLPPDARQWINRAIDRISAMAGVHDLFSGAPHRVTLAELLDRTVQSLSVVKPAGVVVTIDLKTPDARLRTERAVSLAMAVHELCCNGIVHGLGSSGTLIIRSRRDNGNLSVEVEDQSGAGAPTEPAAVNPTGVNSDNSGHTGIGLTLVRGLVSRELRGQFSLAPGPAGTIATLHFPLLPDEVGTS
jgi:two-component sensor histidine kinase